MNDDQEKLLFIHYIENNSIQDVQLMIASGLDLNFMTDDFSALSYAVMKDRLKIVKLLLENGADANFVGQNLDRHPLLIAASKHYEYSKILLKSGANINVFGKYHNALMGAIICKSSQLAHFLIESDIDLNYISFNGLNAYEMAKNYELIEIASAIQNKMLSNVAQSACLNNVEIKPEVIKRVRL